MIWRLLYAIPTWILFIILWIPLVLIGHIVIPILLWIGLRLEAKSKFKIWPWVHTSSAYNHLYQGFPWLFYIWANEGDGIYPPEYERRYPQWSQFRLAWTWLAVRNPVNNLRFVPGFSCKIDPKRVRFVGSLRSKNPSLYDAKNIAYWYFAWCGPYSCYRRQYYRKGRMVEFWIGWKIWPIDQYEVSPYRKYGAGFAMQWRYL